MREKTVPVVYHGSIQRVKRDKLSRFLRAFAAGEGPDFGDYSDGILGDARDLETLTPEEARAMANRLESTP